VPNDIDQWLRGLDLAKYVGVFIESEIGLRDLPHLTEGDLRAMGLPLGPRRRVLAAAAALADPMPGRASDELNARSQAERRQLTVLFSDLVDSTELSTRFDPEDMSAIIRSYHSAVTDEIRRLDGHIARYMGDGVLAYFGYPRAHENAAEMAVRAGLEIVSAVSELSIPGGGRLRTRVGIATGGVVVGELIGEGAAQEESVVGETPNLAARMQTLAEPDTVVIAARTQRLVGGLFELVDLAPQRLKGFAEPIRAYRVLGRSRREDRFEALRGQHLTPLVGRERELGVLLDRFKRARAGEGGQVILLSGEPGIGKSRIVYALRSSLRDEPYMALRGFCSPHHTNSVLYPVIGLLERAAGLERHDPPTAKLTKLEALLALGARHLDEVVPLIAELLEIPVGDKYPPLALTAERKKQRTLEVLVDQLAGLAAKQPLLAICEDAHWIDPTTLELLDLLIERIQTLPVLVLITHRPEFNSRWSDYSHVMELVLNRLARDDGAAMLEQITRRKTLPPRILDQILLRTDGVPLFIEELISTVLESGLLVDAGDHYELSGPVAPIPIPATLQDSLMARLDRLAPVKEVAQLAAVIGREFAHEQLAAVSTFSASQLAVALDQLIESGLVFRRGVPPNATYRFKHALVQDAAYQSLLHTTRRHYHAQIAQLFERRFPEIRETQPELMAHHYGEAGHTDTALRYWHQAGRRAALRGANAEAIGHLTRGLDMLSQLPDTPERIDRELDLRMSLGPVFMAMKGHGAPEVRATYSRARELCDTIGDTARLGRVLAGLCAFHTARGPFATAYEIAEQLLSLAAQRQEPRLLLTARTNLSVNAYLLGKFAIAEDHLEHGMALAQSLPRRENFSQDFGVTCLSYSALTLFSLGYPDQSLERSREAVDLARRLNRPFNLAFALYMASHLHTYRREPEPTKAYAEEGIALCREQDFALWLGGVTLHRGWALAELGRIEEGLREARQGVEAWLATGAEVAKPHHLALLADIHRRLGQYTDGLHSLNEGLATIEALGDRFYEPELHRLMGELTLHQRDGAESCNAAKAEALFRRALQIARAQSARVWELRSAMSLARLLRRRDRRTEARCTLSRAYEWFTEGRELRDLSDARALLASLN
jgi:class 3 adenylate cyclase/tetratricopeptide (TPR) repeat protein